ncbi:MAG: septum formation initiator family protein [Coriobacteriia bacterium]|nr:septum formation initiator family protein [Coriobacteriia bacterium]
MCVAAVLALALWAFYPAARVDYREQREKARLEQELARLKERNTDLRAQVDRLKTPEGVEELARRNLGYVAPGEHVYVVSETAEPTAPVAPLAEERRSTLGQRILDYVFAVE